MAGIEPWNHVENGGAGNTIKGTSREIKHGRTAHNMSSSSLRKKSDISLIQKVKIGPLRQFLTNLQEVILGTKLFILFLLVALTPLAERLSFLTEQIAFYTGPTIGGLLNATCGNATELIIAIFALYTGKIEVVKYSLLGSILSNLLLVLGTSLSVVVWPISTASKDTTEYKQADVNSLLLLMGLLCHSLPLMFRYASTSSTDLTANPTLTMSRVSCIIMLIAYIAYLFFQLKTHRQLFEAQEDASESWGISVSFISIILLPIVGNAAEHAGAVIFAFKNKLDITLGVALGSATQISMFVVPLCVIVAWIMGIEMDLDFNLLETGSFSSISNYHSIHLTGKLDGTSHYLKGLVLLLCYFVIAACFFFLKSPVTEPKNFINMRVGSALSTARNL
ncbi:hypothetical protein MKW92_010213 [Papaver armeniacum]|nr:hypothetical protein MKW92_010213 [Papaver armeniacum]